MPAPDDACRSKSRSTVAELPPPPAGIHSADVAELEDHLREQVRSWSPRAHHR